MGVPGRGHRRGRGAGRGPRRRSGARASARPTSRSRCRRPRCRRRGSPSRARWPRSARPTTATAPATASASPTSTRSAPSAGATSTSSTSSSARAARPTWRPRSNGRRTRTSRSSPTAAARASSAASSRGSRPRFDGAASLDLGALDRVLEVDPVSRAARIGAGASGPRLEEQLGAHGLTMRFYPQSFELSTLGGWIATRAGGHFAVGPTHVDDLVEAVRAITPSGHLGVAAAAGLGRRTLARPAAAGLGGDPRRHHRGVGARAAAPVAPGRARRCASPPSWPAPRRCGRSCRPACAPPTAG